MSETIEIKCVIVINGIYFVGKDFEITTDVSKALIFSNRKRAKRVYHFLKYQKVTGVRIVDYDKL